jgi:cadmium resistance protein CadD (predicted permease)
VGIAAFAATNLDDLLVVSVFFYQAEIEGRARGPVVLGQYLGIGALTSFSLLGTLIQGLLPGPWIGVLGLLPIALGIREWWRLRQHGSGRPQAAIGKAVSWASSVLSVAVVTVSNGADNIGVYLPLFAASPLEVVCMILGVFGVLTACWCAMGYWLGTRPLVTWWLRRHGPKVIPWILVALGLYIVFVHHPWKALP